MLAGLRPTSWRAAALRAPGASAPRRLPSSCPGRRALRVVAMISSNDFRNGTTILVDEVPYRVTEFLHVKPGKGSAFVRTKLKNMLNNTMMEKTFRAGENVPPAEISLREGQFTYAEGSEYVFMDQETYEETRLPKDDWAEFLKEGTVCMLMFFNGKVVSVEPPNHIDLLVTECPPNVKGNTASGSGSKIATLETGAQVTVPLFIEPGTLIRVDTRGKSYLSKVK